MTSDIPGRDTPGKIDRCNMDIQQPPDFKPEKRLPTLIQDAKAFVQRLRSHFHAHGSGILPPELVVPYPPLDAKRQMQAEIELFQLLDLMHAFENVASPLQSTLEESGRSLQAARERVDRLAEQADRHGISVSESFARKVQRAKSELDHLLKDGIETKIASMQNAICELVQKLNDRIIRTRQALQALGNEQREENGERSLQSVTGRESKDGNRQVSQIKAIWRAGGRTGVERIEKEHAEPPTTEREESRIVHDMMYDSEKKERIFSITAAGNNRDRRRVPILIDFLRFEGDAEVLACAVHALGCIADPGAVPTLIGMTRHADGYVRHQAAWALGNIGDPQARLALMAMLADQTRPLRNDSLGLARVPCASTIGEEARDALARIK